MKSLYHRNLTDEQVNVFENQINFLSFLQTLKVKIEKGVEAESERAAKSFHSRCQLQVSKAKLNSLVEQLRRRTMGARVRFSDQELEELSEEMYRTQLAVDLKLVRMQLGIRGMALDATHSKNVDDVQRALDSEKAIGKWTGVTCLRVK